MFGKNKILKPQNHEGNELEVQEIFSTFQGEGPFVGYPSIFIRLGGCNLACDFCDTEFDSFHKISLENIIKKVLELSNNQEKLIVITGGEPFRQPINKLCQELINLKFLVQIETNGTLYRDIPKEVKIICSPKNNGKNYQQIRADLLVRTNALKFIISASKPQYSDIADVGQNAFKIPVYLQAMDEYNAKKNQENYKLVLELAKKYNARISLQMHKIMGCP